MRMTYPLPPLSRLRHHLNIVLLSSLFLLGWLPFPPRSPLGDEPTNISFPSRSIPYPLDYPPLAVFRLSFPEAWDALSKHSPLGWLSLLEVNERDSSLSSAFTSILSSPLRKPLLKGWKEIPILGSLPPSDFFSALRRHHGREITLFFLPPAYAPRCVVLFDLPRGRERELFLQLQAIGLRPPVVADFFEGTLCLASDASVGKEWTRSSSPPPGSPWEQDLRVFLEPLPDSRASLWVQGEWLVGMVDVVCGLDVRCGCERIQKKIPIALRLDLLPLRNPPAIHLVLGHSPSRIEEIPLNRGDELSRLLRPLSSYPFALLLDLDALCSSPPCSAENGIPDEKESPSLWGSILTTMAFFDPSFAWEVRYEMQGLRMLTGLHPHPFLSELQGKALLLFHEHREASMPRYCWAVAMELRSPEKVVTFLRRATAWYRFFQPDSVATSFSPLPQGFEGAIDGIKIQRGEDEELLIAVGPNRLVIGNEERIAQQIFQHDLSSIYPSSSCHPVLCWRASSALAEILRSAPSLPPSSLMLSILSSTLRGEEKGFLTWRGGDVNLYLEGESVPLMVLLGGMGIASWVEQHLSPRRIADPNRAEALLRTLLEAEEIYRMLELGPLNGYPPGYASPLRRLVEDRNEKGEPLERMFARRFDLAELACKEGYVLFAEAVRHLSNGGALYGYRFYEPRSQGGTRWDPSTTWALLALPTDAEDAPALWIDNSGTVYERTFREEERDTLLDLPLSPSEAGWHER